MNNGDRVMFGIGFVLVVLGGVATLILLFHTSPLLLGAMVLFAVGLCLYIWSQVRGMIRTQRIRGEKLAEQLALRAPINEEEEW